MHIMHVVELIEKAQQIHVNFLEVSLSHGSARNNTQYPLLRQKLNTLQAGSCCAQVLWTRNQLVEYGFKLEKIPILSDNTSAIAIKKIQFNTQGPSTLI